MLALRRRALEQRSTERDLDLLCVFVQVSARGEGEHFRRRLTLVFGVTAPPSPSMRATDIPPMKKLQTKKSNSTRITQRFPARIGSIGSVRTARSRNRCGCCEKS